MEFLVLGPLEVRVDGAPLPLGGRRREMLLALLLVNANRFVTAERLIDDLWDGQAPATAVNSLQSHVSKLRQTIGAERLERAASGYRIRLEPDELDATRFESDLEAGKSALLKGDPTGALAFLGQALQRWRGAAFADVADSVWAGPEASRLEELRMAAIETLLATRLALGQHEHVVSDAEAALATAPLRERIWASLMLALYRSGRQAEALRAYQRLRTELIEALGIEPSAELQALEHDILVQDPRLAHESTTLPDTIAPAPTVSVAPETRPGNLPLQLTSFVGRAEELRALAVALDEARLVTITGVGGVGKTRLALELAAHLQARFSHGALLCELAAVGDPDALAQTIATTLGASQQPGLSLEDSLVAALRTRHVLLLLDNCEHLLTDVARLVDAVLHHCPHARVLATSREALAVDGECVRPLRSLPVPAERAETHLIGSSESVELFVQRAKAVRPTFELDEGSAAPVAEICRRLDGIPLAIELAAARTASMNPTDIASHLSERFRLLAGSRRTAVERHRTLRAAVDWSYSLLSPQEREVFKRLSVFAGGFGVRAAQAVVAGEGIDAADVIDVLAELVAKSMLVPDEAVSGRIRYQLLETLRQYGQDRLEEGGESDAWHRRHAEHHAAFAEEAGPGLEGPAELEWRRVLAAEIDNLRAAVVWALDSELKDDRELALRTVAAFCAVVSADPSLGVGSWATAALHHVDATTPTRRIAVLTAAAWDAFHRGDVEAVGRCATEALRDGLHPGTPSLYLAHVTLGFHLGLLRGEKEPALAILREGHAAIDALGGSDVDHAMLHAAESTVWWNLAPHEPNALQEAERALRRARASRNPSTVTVALSLMGQALLQVDDTEAATLLEESIALSRAGASNVSLGPALANLVAAKLRLGDAATAVATARAGLVYTYEAGKHVETLNTLTATMHVLAAQGEAEVSAVIGGAWEAGQLGSAPAVIDHRPGLARARAELGDAHCDKAMERGASMSYDDVFECAKGALDRLLEPALRKEPA